MKEKSVDMIEPFNQLSLYGYKRYFSLFKNLLNKKSKIITDEENKEFYIIKKIAK